MFSSVSNVSEFQKYIQCIRGFTGIGACRWQETVHGNIEKMATVLVCLHCVIFSMRACLWWGDVSAEGSSTPPLFSLPTKISLAAAAVVSLKRPAAAATTRAAGIARRAKGYWVLCVFFFFYCTVVTDSMIRSSDI